MSDNSQNTHTEEEFREIQEDLIRANKQVKTLKDTAKNYDTTIATLKKKIARLEGKEAEQTPNNLAQEKNEELSRNVEHLRSEITQLQKANKDLMAQKQQLEKKVAELRQAQKMVQKHKEAAVRLEKQVESLKQELEQNKLKEAKVVTVVSPKQTEKIKKLEKELAQARKQISELQATNQARSRPDTPNSNKSDIRSTSTVSNSQVIEFFDGVNLNLEVFEDPRIEYPSNHAKILRLIEDYLSKLKPKFQLSFLNILTASAEAKIDTIEESLIDSSGL